MRKYAVIGLGNFGMNIAKSLIENECEVLGIDIDRDVVEKAKGFLTHAITGNPATKTVLETIGVSEYDSVILSIGQEMVSSVLIALYLKELNARKIIARAISDDHEKILKKLGVDDVIFPERDMAIRIGKTISMKNAVDYLPLSDEYSIMEIIPPPSFIDKSIRELSIGARYRCQILGIKHLTENGREDEVKKTIIAPSADEVIRDGNILIVLGKTTAIERMEKMG